jgi:hypothetical protein
MRSLPEIFELTVEEIKDIIRKANPEKIVVFKG